MDDMKQFAFEMMKKELYDRFMSGEATKAALARECNVSPRTIGRWFDQVANQFGSNKMEDDTTSVADEEHVESEGPEELEIDAPKEIYSFYMSSEELVMYQDTDGDVKEARAYAGTDLYNTGFDMIYTNGFDQYTLKNLFHEINTADEEFIDALEDFGIVVDDNTGLMMIEVRDHFNDEVTIAQIPRELGYRLEQAVKDRSIEDVQRYAMFTENLFMNPSNKCVNELYEFIETTNIDISDDGYVICYKGVRGDFYDCHSGTFRNMPGDNPRVNRNQVNENSEELCSYGLHVCSKNYLQWYGGDRWLKVEVHPKDFVSIPEEYFAGDRAKARVCAYIVLCEIDKDDV